VGTIGPRNLLELLLLAKQAGFSFRILPCSRRAARFGEVTRTFTTPESFAEGTHGSSALLCQLSYNSFRRWRDSNPQPLYEVARAYATLQTSCGGNPQLEK
jgi:hypothetical protein